MVFMAGFFPPGARPGLSPDRQASGHGAAPAHSPLLIAAFDLMWSLFPEPVMLIHRSRQIVRLNEAGRREGRAEGRLCSSYGHPESHQGCLAERLLAGQSAQAHIIRRGPHDLTIHWLPLAGFPDYFIHLSTMSEAEAVGASARNADLARTAASFAAEASSISVQLAHDYAASAAAAGPLRTYLQRRNPLSPPPWHTPSPLKAVMPT
ncbi:hypothetical protein C4J81_05650 [Deltaproteobacteria bacterium Smac51]|nr:hypothetical protein C4J81_05650 [Deltaproteobacteria bacterium Smac51]